MTAVDTDQNRLDDELWTDTISPRLLRGDEANEAWWANLTTTDLELADAVRRALRYKLDDINDQLGQRGAAVEAGELSDDDFFPWRGRALGFKRVLARRYRAVQAAEAALKARAKAKRAEVALADIARQSAAAATKAGRLEWLGQWEAEHQRVVRVALLDLALAVDQHRRETGSDATEVDRLLWAMLDRLTMPPTGPDAEPEILDAIIGRIHATRAGKGKPPLDVFRVGTRQ